MLIRLSRFVLLASFLFVAPALCADKSADWPPSAAALGAAVSAPSEAASAEIVAAELSLKLRVPSKAQGLKLVSVDFFAKDKFVGRFQLFEEKGAATSLEAWKLPPLPAGADTAFVRMTLCDIPASPAGPRYPAKWYSHTWSHFTTGTYKNDQFVRLITVEPTDGNLARWLADSNIAAENPQTFLYKCAIGKAGR